MTIKLAADYKEAESCKRDSTVKPINKLEDGTDSKPTRLSETTTI